METPNKQNSKSSLRRWARQRKVFLPGAAVLAAACALLLYFGGLAFRDYRSELVVAEQRQLLTMAQTVGTSLVNSVEQELESIDLFFSSLDEAHADGDLDTMRQAAVSFLDGKNGLYDAMVCYDENGGTFFEYGQNLFDPAGLPAQSDAVICGKAKNENGWYELFISRRFVYGGKKYAVVYSMNLGDLYTSIVQPVRIGIGGYSVVKDSNLTIIMHHAPGQIGIAADRTAQYPQLDLTALNNWLEMQQTQPEGCSVIDTYVWDDPALRPVRRILAYTTIELPGDTWIVNSTLPYDELNAPLNRMIRYLLGMGFLFFVILCGTVYAMTRGLVRSEAQTREITYLKEINQGMELLRRKDDELQHYQRVQSIGEMSSHIAHEFNNYLTPVQLYGEILESDPSISEENRGMLREMLAATGQAAALSRRLLDFSRQDTAGALTTLDLTEAVRRAAAMVRPLAPRKVDFALELPEAPLYARGREGMADHLLMNLANNAFYAMEEAGGTLTVRLFSADDTIKLTVTDTGKGIPPDTLDKIFEPFYTTKRSGRGTGLGLSVVRSTMTAVGGSVQVDSTVGKGTCFMLTFPQAESSAQPTARLQPVRRLFVVDDDPAMLKAVAALLKGGSCRVSFFGHPAVILSKLQEHTAHCDAVLLDYAMPAMNGLEVAELVRKLDPSIRIFLMSGAEDSRFDWYLKNAIIDEFILKTDLSARLPGLIERNK